ncbi:MAG: NifB/NifX family molybdenum-iron cluster-binding protein [Deltaproteobacteria bacterium]|nr:NifB/NifX family molybdenum-iron cluster-binding protein [Deltaproteobacteria bacterium]
MKTALTVWEDRISPVFDSAHMLLIAEIENSEIINKQYETFNPDTPSQLLNKLLGLEVHALICGAISEEPAIIIEAGGIKLFPFIAGYADEVLESYAKGKQNLPAFLMPGCSQQGSGRKRQGRRKKGNVRIGRQRGVKIMPRKDGTGPGDRGTEPRGQGDGKDLGGSNAGKGPRSTGQGKGGGRGAAKGSGRGKGGGRGKGSGR